MRRCHAQKLCVLAFAFFLVNDSELFAQNLSPLNVANVIPPSPDVAALNKFLDMPMGYSTGVPDISIPVYNLQSGDLNVPISLIYNASGIKVEEVPTWVGLGWNLAAGGSISRIVRGLPDDVDAVNGFLYTTKTPKYILGLPVDAPERYQILSEDVGSGLLDVEPDIYSFSVMGYSGKFYFDQQSRKFVLAPYQNIRIGFSTDATKRIISWTLTLPNGIKCFFGFSGDSSRSAAEIFNLQTTYTIAETTSSSSALPAPNHITSWPVMEIKSPSARSINFYYGFREEINFGRSGEVTDFKGQSGCEGVRDGQKSSFFLQNFYKPVLERISTDLADVSFVQSTSSREDMSGDSRSLDSIIVKTKDNRIVKSAAFTYSYFQSNPTVIPIFGQENTIATKRLYLKTYTESDEAHIISIPYKFYYDTTNLLPSRLSASQDYWGYYNGASNGFYLTPKIKTSAVFGFGSGYIAGADRAVHPEYAKACVLNKIVYPTGGSTDYTYESNMSAGSFSSFFSSFELSGTILSGFQIANNPFIQSGTNLYVDSFEVKDVDGPVHLTSNCDGCSDLFTSDCPLHAVIVGISDPNFTLDIVRNDDYYFYLAPGRYKIRVNIVPTQNFPEPNFLISLRWGENRYGNNLLIGGLRVKKIVSDPQNGAKLARSYRYTSFGNSSLSSGAIYNLPTIAYKCNCGNALDNSFTKVVSNSMVPLTADDGQLVRYANITEFYDQMDSSFKTEYTYSVNSSLTDPLWSMPVYPFPPHLHSNWRSGLLLEKKTFEKLNNGTLRILSDDQYLYKDFDRRNIDSFGMVVNPTPNESGTISFDFAPYSFSSEWFLLDSTISTQYAYATGTGQQSTTTVQSKNMYNDNHDLFASRSTNSKGQVVDTKTWYPYDYNNIGSLATLVNNNLTSVPVKQEISVNGKVAAGRIFNYNAIGKPVEIYQYENANLADTVVHNRNFLVEGNYVSKTKLNYTINGNPRELRTTNDPIKSFIWDYQNNYAIAQVVDADSNSIAYTSFESGGTGNWIGINPFNVVAGSTITGDRYYNENGFNISKTGLSSSAYYIVSYWTRNSTPFTIAGTQAGWPKTLTTVINSGNFWTLYEHQVTGQSNITVSGSGDIDELRLCPKGGLMTSFTYKPLIGITSSCDANNRISYYEYDGFGRLKLIRDQDQNILKAFDYKFASQQ